jgi:hypothetical protein
MSIALIIEKVDGKEIGREFPISTNQVYIQFWEPVVLKEGFLWLDLLLSPGFDLTEVELPEVISEFRRLKQAVPRYYTPDSTAYQHMEERLSGVIKELEALVGKKVELSLG